MLLVDMIPFVLVDAYVDDGSGIFCWNVYTYQSTSHCIFQNV